jgi:hypothetical protein
MSNHYGSEKSGSGSTPSEGSGSTGSGSTGSGSAGSSSGGPTGSGGSGSGSGGSGSGSGSDSCSFLITAIELGVTLMTGTFLVTNTGGIDISMSDVLQGVAGPSYDFVLFDPSAVIAPAASATVAVTADYDMRGTVFELLTDCGSGIGEWPIP